jgi:hypothetical protein
VPAAAVKAAVVAEGETATDAGVVRRVLLPDNATERPPDGAGALSVTVQVLLAPDISDAGAQTREVTVTLGARLGEAG